MGIPFKYRLLPRPDTTDTPICIYKNDNILDITNEQAEEEGLPALDSDKSRKNDRHTPTGPNPEQHMAFGQRAQIGRQKS